MPGVHKKIRRTQKTAPLMRGVMCISGGYVKVFNLDQYLQKSNEVKSLYPNIGINTPIWFRGHSDENHDLIPSLYRGTHKPRYEREMIRDFRLNLHNYSDHVPEREIELLFIMQHYGCPTRLLGWTESSLVALFFAVSSLSKNDGCVWVLQPWSMNSKFFSSTLRSVPEISHSQVTEYELGNNNGDRINRRLKGKGPIAIRPPRKSARILAQRGMFTIHGSENNSLQYFKNKHEDIRLDKIVVDGSKKKEIMRQLATAGITHSVLFPEISGLAEEIKYRYLKDNF